MEEHRQSILANAREAERAKDFGKALQVLDLGASARPWLSDDKEFKTLHVRIAREAAPAEARRQRQRAKEQEATATANRRQFAKLLRDRYLDKGLNIFVTVSGAHAERLTLRFALFNEVWTHQFAKGDLIEEIRIMGFKRVDFTDGYNFDQYFLLHPPT
jgi:hypothetical protein